MKRLTREDITVLTIKPRLKRELRFVPEETADWEDRDFIAIMNKPKSEGVLVAELEARYAVPFRLQKRIAGPSGRLEAIICDICATWQRGSNSAVISFLKERRSVSFLCCGDLSCSFHVRDQTPEAKLSRVHLRESLSVDGRVARLRLKLETILRELK